MPSPGRAWLDRAVRAMSRLSVGELERMVRQAEGRKSQAMMQLLGALGPAGRLVRGLLGDKRHRRQAADAAQKLLREMGYKVLPPVDERGKSMTVAEYNQAVNEVIAELESRGYMVTRPDEVRRREPGELPFGIPAKTKRGRDRSMVEIPIDGRMQRFSVYHPIVTREMVEVEHSSNVHSYGYDVQKGELFVRFLGRERSGARGGRGPLYAYSGVPARVFLAMMDASSKGTFVWDELRIRGTVSGHQYDYRLAGLGASTYVPRKATAMPDGEYYMPRNFFSYRTGQTLSSSLPEQLVRPWGGQPNRGDPNRGRPNRGRP